MKLTETHKETTQRICVYGPPKSGKTELVGRLAEKYRLRWIDLEEGWKTLLKLPREWQERIDIIRIPDDKDFPIAVETVRKILSGAKVSICAQHGKVGCPACSKDPTEVARMTEIETRTLAQDEILVIDSLTQLSNSAMSWIMKNAGKADDFKPERDEWGQLKFVIENTLSKVQQARYNIICISHEEEVELESGVSKLVPVSGSSKSSRNTAKYFDHVVYCDLRNKKHNFGSATTYANSILTGSRLDVKIENLAVPSLLPFFELPPDTSTEEFLKRLQATQAAVSTKVETAKK